MSFKTPPSCPQCNSPLPVGWAWSRSPSTGTFGGKRPGIVCPVCGARLVILPGGLLLATFIILGIGGVLTGLALIELSIVLNRQLTQGEMLAGGVVVGSPFLVLYVRIAPRFAHVRMAREGEAVYYPISRRHR